MAFDAVELDIFLQNLTTVELEGCSKGTIRPSDMNVGSLHTNSFCDGKVGIWIKNECFREFFLKFL